MAERDLKIPQKALLMAGIIYAPKVGLETVRDAMESVFGKIIMDGGPAPFVWTKYYEKEMGAGLMRYFVAFDTLVDQDMLPELKIQAMEMEKRWLDHGARRVNIDPGILTPERLVLATTKNFTHRIYLGKGIFADLTLIFKKGRFAFLDWTYPDYKSDLALGFLIKARRKYLEIIKAQRG